MQTGNDDFSWSAWPAAERPWTAAFALMVIAALAASTWWGAGPEWGVSAGLGLLASVNRFFLISRFTIAADRLIVRRALSSRTLSWSVVRWSCLDRHSAWLAPTAPKRHRFGSGDVQVHFGRHRDEVMRRIQERLRAVEAGQTPVGSALNGTLPAAGVCG